jgi:hypothetical protein
LESFGEDSTVQYLLHFPFRLGSVNHRDSFFLTLTWKGVRGIFAENFGWVDRVAGLFTWDSDLIGVAYLSNDLMRAVVLVSELLARSVACPVPGRDPNFVSNVPVNWPSVFVGLDPLTFLGLRNSLLAPLPDFLDPLHMGPCILS